MNKGSLLLELIITIGLAALLIPVLLLGLMSSRDGKPQQEKRVQAVALMKETVNAVRSVRDNNWTSLITITQGAPYHPVVAGNQWALQLGVASTSAGLTQSVVGYPAYRTSSGSLADTPTGNVLDPSTMRFVITISWTKPFPSLTSTSVYLTRTVNTSKLQTTKADFTPGVATDTLIQSSASDDGSIRLANNNRAKWCSPTFSNATIDLPDGPPVAVAATASAISINSPNDVFVATAPSSSSAVKMAYINVSANVATPAATLKGTFTLDSSKYTSGTYPSSLGGLTNAFKTNDVKYYRAPSGNLYGLLATDDPTHEVVVVQIKNNNGNSDAYQDPTNNIYKYWTYFNTKINSVAATNDQAPWGYGGISISILGTRGYVISGGFLYVFDLSNIDSANTTTSLPMIGCRIQLDGYDCKPGASGNITKYGNGQTGTTYASPQNSTHPDCSDGGNIELYADNDIDTVKVGSNTYVYVAVGSSVMAEFNIVDVTTPPTGSNLTNSACGSSGTYSPQWRKITATDALDFNSDYNTEEAANSVYAKSDGTRAYISSNGGIDGNGDGVPDSKQFYVIDTTTKTAPKFLSKGSYGVATSGFYDGAPPAPAADKELFPRRSLTVLNGDRAVLVGKDGFANSNDAEEYQVLELDNPNETTPTYCGGLNFNQGFNDLTSVSELDNDNYVYMVANTTANELKIIEGGPDNAIYVADGTYLSAVFDTASVDMSTLNKAFNRFVANITQPAQTSITFQMAVTQAGGSGCPTDPAAYTFLGPGRTSAPSDVFKTTSTGTIDLSGLIPLLTAGSYNNQGRCFRYKAYLHTDNQLYTPTLNSMQWNYSQ